MNILIVGGLRPNSIGGMVARDLVQGEHSVTLTTSEERRLRIYERRWSDQEKAFYKQTEGVSTGILDVTSPESIKKFFEGWQESSQPPYDGVVYAVAGGPPALLGGLQSLSDSEKLNALQVNVFGLHDIFLAGRECGAWSHNASFVGLSGSTEIAFEGYGWMGPLKNFLKGLMSQMAVTYTVYRFSLVECGPIETMAAKAIPGFDVVMTAYKEAQIISIEKPFLLAIRTALHPNSGSNIVLLADGGLAERMPFSPNVMRQVRI